jgi:hypothetical protein
MAIAGTTSDPGRTRCVWRPGAGLVLVLGYLAAVGLVGALPALTGVTRQSLVGASAFSPDDLVGGRLWLLALSGFVVDGDAWPQIASLVEVALVLTLVAGARTFWRAAIGAHVGSTLIAYALIAVLLAVAPASVHGLASAPDYGISCVFAGALGAAAVVGARRCARRPAAVALFALVASPMAALVGDGFVAGGRLDLAAVEHALAFALGVLAGMRHRPAGAAGIAPRRSPAAVVPAPSAV